jgi:hypothetical protein
MRAVIWAAVSSTPQRKGRNPKEDTDEDAGYSLAEQVKDGLAVCKRREWDIVETDILS